MCVTCMFLGLLKIATESLILARFVAKKPNKKRNEKMLWTPEQVEGLYRQWIADSGSSFGADEMMASPSSPPPGAGPRGVRSRAVRYGLYRRHHDPISGTTYYMQKRGYYTPGALFVCALGTMVRKTTQDQKRPNALITTYSNTTVIITVIHVIIRFATIR